MPGSKERLRLFRRRGERAGPDSAALLTVYIVLGGLYEITFIRFTILSTLPSAGVGALLASADYRTRFSVTAD